MPSVILKRGKDHRLHAGHCWVYAGEIDKLTGDPKDGDAVDIRDYKDRFLGRGLLNTNSQITVRRFTTQKEELDKAFFTRRIEAALEYRRENTSIGDANAFRVVCSESDMLPGLIVDRYGDHFVLQALTLGIDQRKAQIIQVLRELFDPSAIVERNDVPSRKLEGLEETKGVVFGETDAVVRLQFDHFSVEVNLLEDQKTGFFLDQRDNYSEVARLCTGKRVLDCFSYHGGFALAAGVSDAKSVEAVEISEYAVARARKNADLNGLTGKIEFVCANAFDVLKKYDAEKHEYDVIVLDPPTFTRTKQNIEGALRGYKEINLRALKMLSPGGILATFTCSHHIDAELFKSVVVDAAADAKKTIRLVKALTQSPDHPILPAIPESEYLRGLLLQVM
jgi:23S rRNA (cytosine1962-C5)-methyltransferase